jgi:hypothetical protein
VVRSRSSLVLQPSFVRSSIFILSQRHEEPVRNGEKFVENALWRPAGTVTRERPVSDAEVPHGDQTKEGLVRLGMERGTATHLRQGASPHRASVSCALKWVKVETVPATATVSAEAVFERSCGIRG